VVGVVDEAGERPPAGERQLERLNDELCAHVRVHRPADDRPREAVGDRGEVELALVGRDLLDVGCPQLVGPGGGEVATDEVVGGHDARHAHRRAGPAAHVGPLEARRDHQPLDALAPHAHAPFAELGMDARRAIQAAAGGVDAPDLVRQPGVR
jgi:hypothetical protein